MFPLKVDNLVKWWFPIQLLKTPHPQIPSGPTFYSTTFPVFDSGGDTFLYLPGWTKVLDGAGGGAVRGEAGKEGQQKLSL